MVVAAHLFARALEEIRAEARRAQSLRPGVLERGEVALARRIEAHIAAYRWLLGDLDVAPVTGRRVAALTTRDLAIEQDEGRDHAEQNTLPYNHPDRLYPEAVFDAIAWARGQHDDDLVAHVVHAVVDSVRRSEPLELSAATVAAAGGRLRPARS